MYLCTDMSKINDWDSDSDERRTAGPSATARTVVLKKMFTLAELDEDPTDRKSVV